VKLLQTRFEIDYMNPGSCYDAFMASIKDVARAAGVSTATVSRVLANKAFIRPETRERVLRAVAELKYRPNLLARSLRSQRRARIGLVFSDIRNPFFAGLSRAVEDAAYEKGCSILICNIDEDPQEALYLDLLRGRM
jgi:LacI family fructose operon transcriptional repressor